MYHIKNDLRSQKSAELIYHSLRNLLWNKSLNDITITDIHNDCGVSRMTFYRLFDNLTDVLSWKLSIFVDHYNSFKNDYDDKLLFFFTYWKKHIYLISLLSNDARFILSDLFSKNRDLNDSYQIYLTDTKISIMSTLLSRWAKRNAKETPLEMKNIALKIFSESTNILTNI